MKIGGILIGALCALAASIINVHFFLDPVREVHRAVSADGLLALEGKVYEDQQFSLESFTAEARMPLSPFRYTLSPQDAIFAQPITASFFSDADHAVLYYWNERDGYWVALPGISQDGYTQVSLSHGGTYALGKLFTVASPTFVDILSDLRSRLPKDAVGYRVHAIATSSGGAPILLHAAVEQGACGGLPVRSEALRFTQEERVVQVLVNDVLTPTTFTFLGEIYVTPGGCSEDMPMQVIF